jgi:hypothetical protein
MEPRFNPSTVEHSPELPPTNSVPGEGSFSTAHLYNLDENRSNVELSNTFNEYNKAKGAYRRSQFEANSTSLYGNFFNSIDTTKWNGLHRNFESSGEKIRVIAKKLGPIEAQRRQNNLYLLKKSLPESKRGAIDDAFRDLSKELDEHFFKNTSHIREVSTGHSLPDVMQALIARKKETFVNEGKAYNRLTEEDRYRADDWLRHEEVAKQQSVEGQSISTLPDNTTSFSSAQDEREGTRKRKQPPNEMADQEDSSSADLAQFKEAHIASRRVVSKITEAYKQVASHIESTKEKIDKPYTVVSLEYFHYFEERLKQELEANRPALERVQSLVKQTTNFQKAADAAVRTATEAARRHLQARGLFRLASEVPVYKDASLPLPPSAPEYRPNTRVRESSDEWEHLFQTFETVEKLHENNGQHLQELELTMFAAEHLLEYTESRNAYNEERIALLNALMKRSVQDSVSSLP